MSLWSAVLLASTYTGVLLAAVIPDADVSTLNADSQADDYLNYLRYLLAAPRQTRTQHQALADYDLSKPTEYAAVPLAKHRGDKRTEKGVWIWMPAQGYVSVPHQHEQGATDLTKPGKIMRYG